MIVNESTETKILALLSFGSKMRKLIYGKERLEKYLDSNGVKIVFLASDCSDNTYKFWRNKTKKRHAKCIEFQQTTKKELAKKLGKKELSAVSTTNKDLLKGIIKLLEKV